LNQISAVDLEMSVLKPMLEVGRSPNTIRNTLLVFSGVWNLAVDLGIVSGDNRPAAEIGFSFSTPHLRLLAGADGQAIIYCQPAHGTQQHQNDGTICPSSPGDPKGSGYGVGGHFK
jgi:hypothetical protein